jgi:hypothetical protein
LRLKNVLRIAIVFICIIVTKVNAQEDPNIRIGTEEISKSGANYYNYADRDKVNIEVSMLGYVRSPGKYLIPQGMRTLELITLGGGIPFGSGQNADRKIESIKLFRFKNDTLNIGRDQVIELNYVNVFGDDIQTNRGVHENPVLMPGDVLYIKPGEPIKYYTTRDDLVFVLSIASALTSIAILIVNVLNK